MCGIAGVLALGARPPRGVCDPRVEAMVQAMRHRGPNEAGTAVLGAGSFGATRLAIRGVANGAQPVTDAHGQVIAVCNGEIDNYRKLRVWLAARGHTMDSDSDVAVIPGLYLELGEAFVERLKGAFALVLHDPQQNLLLLARDRAGERPLYYARSGDEILFASEIAALIGALPGTPGLSAPAIGSFLRFGYIPAPASPVDGMQKLGPAESLRFDTRNGEAQSRRYWSWRVGQATKQAPDEDAFDQVFRDAVAKQTDVEVPYGVFLSGGIDSSLIAAVCKDVHSGVSLKGYTLRFAEESYDEGDYASLVADTLDIEARSIWVGPEDLAAEIERLVALTGEPLADPAWAPTALCARKAAEEITVALGGEGADELFGGYPTYLGIGLARRYRALPRSLRRGLQWPVTRWPVSDKKVALSFLFKRFAEAAELDGYQRHLLWTSNIGPGLLARLGIDSSATALHSPLLEGSTLDRVQYHDFTNSLAEGLLTKADRAGMSAALELRTPFLDPDVAEFAASLADGERVRGVRTKVFLKRYALRYLPSRIVYRRKRGLSIPLARWLRGPLLAWAQERPRSPRLETAGVAPLVALEILDEHQRRIADHGRTLWTLIVLSLWLDWLAGNGSSGAQD